MLENGLPEVAPRAISKLQDGPAIYYTAACLTLFVQKPCCQAGLAQPRSLCHRISEKVGQCDLFTLSTLGVALIPPQQFISTLVGSPGTATFGGREKKQASQQGEQSLGCLKSIIHPVTC